MSERFGSFQSRLSLLLPLSPTAHCLLSNLDGELEVCGSEGRSVHSQCHTKWIVWSELGDWSALDPEGRNVDCTPCVPLEAQVEAHQKESILP